MAYQCGLQMMLCNGVLLFVWAGRMCATCGIAVDGLRMMPKRHSMACCLLEEEGETVSRQFANALAA